MGVLDTFGAGIAPDHWPALLGAALLPGVVRLAQRVRAQRRTLAAALDAAPAPDPAPALDAAPALDPATAFSPVPGSAGLPPYGPAGVVGPAPGSAGPRPDPPAGVPLAHRVAAWLLGLSAAVHLALPLGHNDSGLLLAGFLGSGLGYAWLAVRAAGGRRFKTLSVLLILATLLAYMIVLGRGGEEPDQVGIATAMVELLTLALCLVPERAAQRRRLARRIAGSISFTLVVLVFGTVLWLEAFLTHGDTGQVSAGGHHHGHAARAQAGVVMTPVDDEHPTPAQVAAAAQLASRTKAELARYTDIRVALAAGYVPQLKKTGLDVHMEKKAYGNDGHVLDPTRPEMLMYAIADGRATLLSAVYTVPVAGRDAPTPGGPLTRWHSHNVCLTALPPGFTVVNIYGTCPPFSVMTTVPQMMHVWVVDNPGGPYADGVPDSWTRTFNRTTGLPFSWQQYPPG